jgi:hypothetical protein
LLVVPDLHARGLVCSGGLRPGKDPGIDVFPVPTQINPSVASFSGVGSPRSFQPRSL